MRVLVLNCGSSSLKFELIELDAGGNAPPRDARRLRGTIERIGGDAAGAFLDADGRWRREALALRTHAQATHHVFSLLRSPSSDGSTGIDAVGHRVVHGGERFTATTLIDPDTLAAIEGLNELAPLHNPVALSGIAAARAVVGDDVPMAAVFDTAFHHTLPDYAAAYAIPADVARRHHIRRYGFHGIAHRSVAARYGHVSGVSAEQARLITLHLGNGCSATAIRNGQSVDTSMGFTPLEGLMMGTRCGDLDPAVVSYLMRRETVAAEVVDEWLNHRSGLLGISGRSPDMRELTAAMDGDAAARLAVEMFCYRASKYVGAYLTVLGGADALIFSGGIGENSPVVRTRICDRLQWCGLVIDPERNAAAVGREAHISRGNGLQAYVIPADEELLIAQETMRAVSAGGAGPSQSRG